MQLSDEVSLLVVLVKTVPCVCKLNQINPPSNSGLAKAVHPGGQVLVETLFCQIQVASWNGREIQLTLK